MSDGGVEARFAALVQSPLRASLLRFLHAHPRETFDAEQLMQAFGRMRLDVENCLVELESFGVAARAGRRRNRYRYAAPPADEVRALVDGFAQAGAAPSREERSEAARRFREMIGRDEKMLIVFEWIRTAAKADIAVLILGATGSGKDVVAHMIHELSPRRDERFQAVDCAAVPEALFEPEIFGHEKGAFTGAHERRAGKLELADKGTLFLDEIGELSLPVQGKLLRAIEQQRFERLGGTRPIDVDFRLISATNQPIEQMVRDGAFREDLYYRLNAFSIRLPSLRERAVDIPILAERFLAQQAAARGLAPDARRFSAAALKRLAGYGWPGNIRELESVVSRALLSSGARLIDARDLAFLDDDADPARGGARRRVQTLADAERQHIHAVLEAEGWNKRRAAEALGVSRGTLYRKIEEYGLRPT
ncbi:MAG TPA: sigma-54 dependent transcriptional regulator [Vicinamibacterales bacterium]